MKRKVIEWQIQYEIKEVRNVRPSRCRSTECVSGSVFLVCIRVSSRRDVIYFTVMPIAYRCQHPGDTGAVRRALHHIHQYTQYISTMAIRYTSNTKWCHMKMTSQQRITTDGDDDDVSTDHMKSSQTPLDMTCVDVAHMRLICIFSHIAEDKWPSGRDITNQTHTKQNN